MQSVQTTFYPQPIIPGETPVFLVSPDGICGNRLALLLSENVLAPRAFARIGDDLEVHSHYFSNLPARKILHGVRESGYGKTREYLDKINLLLEESSDNGRLWGLEVDYEMFFRLELFQKDPAFFLFLYDDAENLDAGVAGYLRQMADFANEHPHRCAVIHRKQIDTVPELLLQALPFARRDKLVREVMSRKEEKRDGEEGSDKKSKVNIGHAATAMRADIQRLEQCNVINPIAGLLKGDQIQIIICYNGEKYQDVLQVKLDAIRDWFVMTPALSIICPDEAGRLAVQKCLISTGFSEVGGCHIHVASESVKELNSIIAKVQKPYILIDNLNLQAQYDDLLTSFSADGDQPRFVAGDVNGWQELELSDLLTTHIIHDLVVFPRALWKDNQHLSEELDASVVLWDFAIRALREDMSRAIAVPAQATDGAARQEVTQLLEQPAYREVIQRHEVLFEENAQKLIGLLTEHMHRPQQEISHLHRRITSLQTMQTHAQNELRAVNDLSASLQKRIRILENRWHYKLNAKIKRFKKIFFKKNTTGTGRLKKILTFLSFTLSKPGMAILRNISKRGLKKLYLMAETRPVQITYLDEASNGAISDYSGWIRFRQNKAEISKAFRASQTKLKLQPKISIVMPVYNPPPKYLKAAIESVLRQDYRNWELCIADDCSPGERVGKVLRAYMLKDPRIKVKFREENGHISACSNSALELATGEYILFMDHDDLLSYDCLFEVVRHINEHPSDELIYSDEDKINEDSGHENPHFKPDWAPDSLLSRNYMGHVVVMKKALVDKVGGFRLGFEGSQDYDILLRATEQTEHIGHIPKVLYHWRIHGKSAAHSEEVKPYAYIAAKRALEEALDRRKTPGEVSYLSGLRGYRIHYDIPSEGKVSIIIPTKDQTKLLKNTIDSILHHTDYRNYEIIVLNNNSSSRDFFDLMDAYTHQYSDRFQCIDCNFPFNFSKLMNIGARAATGEYLLLLNNDVEIIHEDWLRGMVSYAQHPKHGAVGVKLLYPDDHIQHAGVIVGLGGVAGHAFVNAYKDDAGYFNYIQSVNNFSAVTAACLMVRKEVYDEVGGMEELFEVEYNDVDLCLKFIEAGYYNVYVPDVELYHFESVTRGHPHQSRESWERHIREIRLFKAKWKRYIDHDPCYNPNLNIGAHDFSMDFSAGTPDYRRHAEDDELEPKPKVAKTPAKVRMNQPLRQEDRALLN